MVQLKESVRNVKPNRNQVSIPYGTIKSRKRNRWDGLKYGVSIPYGTIKSFSESFVINNVPLFQFLMVQLKATLVGNPQPLIISFNSLWYN